jgi:beta-xylosidase
VLAAPGQNVAILASRDLTNWTPIATRIVDDGTWEFTDPDSPSFARRFYESILIGE